MATPQSVQQQMQDMAREMKSLGGSIERDMLHLQQSTDVGKWVDRSADYIKHLVSKPRNLWLAGGILGGYLLLSALFGSSRSTRVLKGEGQQIIVQREAEGSLLGSLLRTALQTFVLMVARKLLMDYLQKNQPAKPAAK